MPKYTIISKFSSWVYHEIEAPTLAEALQDAHEIHPTDEEIIENVNFQGHQEAE